MRFKTGSLSPVALTFLMVVSAHMLPRARSSSLGDRSQSYSPKSTILEQFKTHDTSFIELTSLPNVKGMSQALHSGNEHGIKITIRLTAFNKTFTLELHQNKFMFSSSYVEKTVTNTEQVEYQVHNDTNGCYYTGHVAGREDSSTAAISTCHGISGYIAVDNEIYYVEPQTSDILGQHFVFRESDITLPQSKCGVKTQERQSSFIRQSVQQSIAAKKTSFNWPQDLDGQTLVVEVYVVNSYAQYLSQDSSTPQVVSRTKSMINVMNSLYRSLNIYFVLVGIETWTRGELISVRYYDPTKTLISFLTYRAMKISPIHYNDIAYFITDSQFSEGVIGEAPVGSMCSYRLSGAIISDISSVASRAASTMTHETGHSFGLQHDPDVGCSCNAAYNGNWIMCPYLTEIDPTKWSFCSLATFSTLSTRGTNYCLKDKPTTFYDTISYCGNGIIENDEECDCDVDANLQQCNYGCCDMTTCKLIGSAKCASGRCCDTFSCQLRSSGYECRPASGACDLSEYCNGVDPVCPSDVYKRDSTSCHVKGAEAYCYQGQCQSHDSQCQLLWGSNSHSSNEKCYETFNRRGNSVGNCGVTDWLRMTYSACSSENYLCGQLQCDWTKTLVSFTDLAINASSATIFGFVCNSTVIDVGLQRQSPGLVPTGAKCGENKMCYSQKCVDISSLSFPSCASGCNGHGICNSLGQCHCYDGFDPASDCSRAGSGGSIHSGPATSNSSTSPTSSTQTAILTAPTTRASNSTTRPSLSTTSTTPKRPSTEATRQLKNSTDTFLPTISSKFTASQETKTTGNSSGASACFPGDASVVVYRTRSLLPMNQLSVGDLVLTLDVASGETFYDEVIAFSHQLSDGTGQQTYSRLTLDNGRSISATPYHLICVVESTESSCNFVFFADVKPGFHVLYSDGTLSRRLRVSNVTVEYVDKGLYSPLTSTGTMLVDGVFVSCYATIPYHSVMHVVWSPIRLVMRLLKYADCKVAQSSVSSWLSFWGEELNQMSKAWVSMADLMR